MKSTMQVRLFMSAGALALAHPLFAQPDAALPIEAPQFDGVIGQSLQTSRPGTPFEVKAPEAAPNVLLILTDDVGFGATTPFGGLVPTPNFDRLAKRGLQYNRFNVAAMCSPTRAALLTGVLSVGWQLVSDRRTAGRNGHISGHKILPLSQCS
jgi:arylsulfatase